MPIETGLQNSSNNCGIVEDPVIYWKYGRETGTRVQKSCRITICDGEECVYDSREMKTQRQNNHKCICNLKTHVIYTVRVTVTDDAGITETGAPFTFVSGVAGDTGWKGKWISDGTSRPQCLGTELELKKNIRFAAISTAGVGQYQMEINGRLPDDSVLNGSWTDYHKHIHYQTYDITDFLSTGKNEIVIELGNGWYCADTDDERHFYTAHAGYEPFGSKLAAIALMTVVYEDGEREVFGTDGSWWSTGCGTTYTNIYGSEDYDARIQEHGERLPAAELGRPEEPDGKLVPMLYPPVKVKKIYHGKWLRNLEGGGALYDLGQNMSGLFEVCVKGKRGTKIRIIPVEKLDIQGNPWRSADSWCCYTLKGGEPERWKPRFTYGAGRYVEISPAPESREKEMPEILEVSGHFITSSAKEAGSFYCSDHRYMQIHDLVLRAIESNLNHVHTDCPTIEKLGWQEPNHLMGPSVFYVKDAETLWSKIAMDERDSQYGEGEHDVDRGAFGHLYSEGLLTSVAPRYARFLEDGGEGSFWDIPPWGSSILLAAYEQYRFTGNKDTLIANYSAAQKYVDYLYQKYLDYAVLYHKKEGVHFLCHGLGDWGIEQNRGESRENIETAYLYRDLVILAMIAEWTGKNEDAAGYREKAAGVLKEYNSLLLKWNPSTGEWAYDSYEKTGLTPTQATQAIPLQFGMVPEDKAESVKRSFLLTCGEHKIHSGEIGLPYILRTLGEMKRSDIVRDMMLQEYHPSYYRFIEQGETTLPEFWRDDSRSRNHDMMGAVLEWFYRYLAGISSEDGFSHIRIEPDLPEGADRVICSYSAVTGLVEADIRRCKDNKLRAEISIPPNTEGTVCLGGRETHIHGGSVYMLEAEIK